MKVLSIFGTRPEAIKMAMVVKALEHTNGIESLVCVTGQHRQMLDQVLTLFEITPDVDLDLMTPGQSLEQVTARALTGLTEAIRAHSPDWVLVHGDTTTAMTGALAAFYAQVRIGHVEAGLRTHNLRSPWPEEGNRAIIGRLAELHFAPTEKSRQNLLQENIAEDAIYVTGNTVIDALHHVVAQLKTDATLQAEMKHRFPYLDKNKRLILMTGHRRENFDGGLERVMHALNALTERGDVQVVYPVHLNPNVRTASERILGKNPSVHLIEPLDYLPFVYLMSQSYLIITDSGGVQEEAPSLGKPVFVTRNTTERPEAVEAGTIKLVGTDTNTLLGEVSSLLDDPILYERTSRAHNPYGDGQASARIVEAIVTYCKTT